MSKIFVDMGCAQDSSLKFELQRIFNQETSVLCSLYSRLLPDFKIRGLRKVNVTLTDSFGEYHLIPVIPGINVVSLSRTFDFDNFFKLPERDRSRHLLEVLHSNILSICTELKWDTEPFIIAYEGVKKENYVNRWKIEKDVKSKDKKYISYIEAGLSTKVLVLSAVFTDIDKIFFKRVELIKLKPSEFFLNDLVKNGKWVNNKDFIVANPGGEIVFKVTMDTGLVEILLSPKIHTLDSLLQRVKMVCIDPGSETSVSILEEKIRSMTK